MRRSFLLIFPLATVLILAPIGIAVFIFGDNVMEYLYEQLEGLETKSAGPNSERYPPKAPVAEPPPLASTPNPLPDPVAASRPPVSADKGNVTVGSTGNLFNLDITVSVGKAVEKAAQDAGKAIAKAAQDASKAVEKADQPDPFEEQRIEIERHLRSIPARYNMPERLTYGRSMQISFVLEPQGVGTGTDRLKDMPGTIVPLMVQVSPQVKAELTGPEDLVQIKLRGGDEAKRRAVTLVAPVQWVWDVKAVGEGTVNLQLELIAYIPNKDKETSFQWPTFHRQIPIEILWQDRAKRFVTDMSSVISPVWASIATVATAIAGLLAYFGWKPSFGQGQESSSKENKPRARRSR